MVSCVRPRLAICSTLLDSDDAVELLCGAHDDLGIEFRIDAHRIGDLPEQVETVRRRVQRREVADLEMRYHFPLGPFELSHAEDDQATRALRLMQSAVGHIAETGGTFFTVHLALPGDAPQRRFERACDLLGELVHYGAARGVRVCLENLRWGITSQPEHFIELVDASDAGITFDVGHAISSDAASGFPAARFALELGDRIENVHVYGREEAVHLPPRSIADIQPVVDALLATQCSWWTIELFGLTEVTFTRDMLLSYFDSVHLGLRGHPQAIR
jgi:sugar phosphate isomerase/epimerase